MPVSAFNPGPYHAVVQTVFANGAGNAWPVGQGTNGSTQLSNGRYALTSSGGRTFVRNPEEFQHQAAGEVQATLSLAGTGRAGVMGRWSQTPDGQQSMYAFWIADNGTFGLTRWQQGSASELATPQASPFIHRGGDNELVLRAQGDELTCWINGGQVFSHSDSSPLAAGDWGLYVASQLGGATVTGSYTQVTIYSKNL